MSDIEAKKAQEKEERLAKLRAAKARKQGQQGDGREGAERALSPREGASEGGSDAGKDRAAEVAREEQARIERMEQLAREEAAREEESRRLKEIAEKEAEEERALAREKEQKEEEDRRRKIAEEAARAEEARRLQEIQLDRLKEEAAQRAEEEKQQEERRKQLAREEEARNEEAKRLKELNDEEAKRSVRKDSGKLNLANFKLESQIEVKKTVTDFPAGEEGKPKKLNVQNFKLESQIEVKKSVDDLPTESRKGLANKDKFKEAEQKSKEEAEKAAKEKAAKAERDALRAQKAAKEEEEKRERTRQIQQQMEEKAKAATTTEVASSEEPNKVATPTSPRKLNVQNFKLESQIEVKKSVDDLPVHSTAASGSTKDLFKQAEQKAKEDAEKAAKEKAAKAERDTLRAQKQAKEEEEKRVRTERIQKELEEKASKHEEVSQEHQNPQKQQQEEVAAAAPPVSPRKLNIQSFKLESQIEVKKSVDDLPVASASSNKDKFKEAEQKSKEEAEKAAKEKAAKAEREAARAEKAAKEEEERKARAVALEKARKQKEEEKAAAAAAAAAAAPAPASTSSQSLTACHDCKTENKVGWKFCDNCGARSKIKAPEPVVTETKPKEEVKKEAEPPAKEKLGRGSISFKLDLKAVPLKKESSSSEDSSDDDEDGDASGKCLTCDAPVVEDSNYCKSCKEFEDKKKEEGSSFVPFKSARGVSGSPFLRRLNSNPGPSQKSGMSSSKTSLVSPRLNQSTSKLGSSAGLSRSNSKLSGTAALLLWVQKRISDKHVAAPNGWKQGWQDGLVLCSLAINFWPGCIDFDSLSKEDTVEARMTNCTIAMKMFEDKGGVPPLLEPEDLAHAEVCEQRSLQTYLSEIRKRLDPHPTDSPFIAIRKAVVDEAKTDE